MSISVKSVQKEVTRLRAELEKNEKVLALLTGEDAAPRRGRKPGRKPAKRAKAKAAAAPKRAVRKPAKAQRAPKRLMTPAHQAAVLTAIGQNLGALELRAALGDAIETMPFKQVLAKLRKDGYLETRGAKRSMVYVRTSKPFMPAPPASNGASGATAEA